MCKNETKGHLRHRHGGFYRSLAKLRLFVVDFSVRLVFLTLYRPYSSKTQPEAHFLLSANPDRS